MTLAAGYHARGAGVKRLESLTGVADGGARAELPKLAVRKVLDVVTELP